MDHKPNEINSDLETHYNWTSPTGRKKFKYRKKKKKVFSKSKFKKDLKSTFNVILWIVLLASFIGSLLIIILNIDLSQNVKKKKSSMLMEKNFTNLERFKS